jgi:hypothetical protein
MKLMICLLLAAPITVWAQNTDSFRNSVGVFVETNALFVGDENPNMKTMGLQYIMNTKKILRYKVSVGYADYWHMPRGVFHAVQADTVKMRKVNRYINLGMVGVGLEVQRQFYRKMYFFAGFDLRAGYGTGKSDTSVNKEYTFKFYDSTANRSFDIMQSNSDILRGPDVTMVYAGFTPYFGLKLEFKHFSVGTSFMNYFAYRSIQSKGGHNDALIDFSSANITQQFFVRYKF